MPNVGFFDACAMLLAPTNSLYTLNTVLSLFVGCWLQWVEAVSTVAIRIQLLAS